MRTAGSKKLLKRARKVIPGGVNSPVRAFGSVGGTARFIVQASGPRIEDVDGNRYLDYVASWGAVIVGHAHPVVVEAVCSAAARGTSFGAPTEAEVELAEGIGAWVPSVEVVRLVNSGTEAVMSALRLARAATGREKFIKFEGCYHGHSNELLAAAGSGVATLGIPGTAGVTSGAVGDTIVVAYNDLSAVTDAFARYPGEIAGVVVEPIAANMGLVQPRDGFLQGLREQCNLNQSLLVFDEVISGFRVARGGAQGRLGVVPDLTTFGKVIGGGLPVGAYGGRRELMAQIAPDGDVFQAGTLSGNPVAVAAGLAVLGLLESDRTYDGLEHVASDLARGLQDIAVEQGIPFHAEAIGGVLGFGFAPEAPGSFSEVLKADESRYRSFFHGMLDQGIYLPPSAFEVAFVTTSHGAAEVDETLTAARRAFKKAL